MEDNKIVELFWKRSESALEETQMKYGRYCYAIAKRILNSDRDAEECVNDAYVNLWNSIPPQRPERLQYYIGALVRNVALNRYDYQKAQKRSVELETVIDEFYECVADNQSLADEYLILREAINNFLASLNKRQRIIFMRRYWHICSVKEIASDMGLTESNVKVSLFRTRNKLKKRLKKEGIAL